jgi:hypothetical protein
MGFAGGPGAKNYETDPAFASGKLVNKVEMT